MGMPITTTTGICYAFPNVCLTPSGPNLVPIPYPSIGQLSDAQDACKQPEGVFAAGNPVVTTKSTIPSTTGDAAGKTGVVSGQQVGGKVEFPKGSTSVFAKENAVVRMFDQTKQNNGNCVGTVLGGVPTVLVGG